MTKLSEQFYQRGNQFLGCRYPFLCGAMTWISEPGLVAAVCNAGGCASLAGGNVPPDQLAAAIEQTRTLTKHPFGVNLITIAPAYQDQLRMLRDNPVATVIFAGNFPKDTEVAMIKDTGAKVICFASTESIAKRMYRYGADALILEGTEAGGHIGHVSLIVLLQQVLFHFDAIPVFVAGGIATGKMSAHLLLMGAAGIQMGTRFAVSKESCAHPAFKDAMLRADARDAVSTSQFDPRLPVVAVRALKNEGLRRFGQLQYDLIGLLNQGHISLKDAQEQVEHFWVGALRRAVQDGDIENGSIMAGQSVGLLDKIQSVQEIISEFDREIETELQRVKKTVCP